MVGSLAQLTNMMSHNGATRIFAKLLAENDNSKNQIYLGQGFTALNVLPHGDIYIDTEARAGSKRDRPKASMTFFWIDENGKHLAPRANLILYPDYPEVRLSGLLRGCRSAPSDLIRPRLTGRVMFFGVTSGGEVLGYVVPDGHPLGNEVRAGCWNQFGVFLEMPLLRGQDPKTRLLAELRRIRDQGWIAGKRFRDGMLVPYSAPNAGGYTLEAELGITPNGIAEPDYHGWEIKQYGVRDFLRYTPRSPITLMTPEPTGGIYQSGGLEEFVCRFGYGDRRGRPNRRNFGGVHKCDAPWHRLTKLRMTVEGLDANGRITNMNGGLFLRDASGTEAASWSFRGLIHHWNRKHAQAVYVPSQQDAGRFRYGDRVLLCEGTDFMLFLRAFIDGLVFYDPAMKVVGIAPHIEIKKRSQFRINFAHLDRLYEKTELVGLP